jgi:hypothetical protein
MPEAHRAARNARIRASAVLRRFDALGPTAWAAALGAAALVTRLPMIFTSTSYANTDYLDIYTDSLVYVDISDDLVSGHGFESAGNYRTGGYPLFLTLLRPLLGGIYDTAAVVQHLLGVCRWRPSCLSRGATSDGRLRSSPVAWRRSRR